MIQRSFDTSDPKGPLRIDHIEVIWVDDDNSGAQSTLGEYSDTPRTGAIDCSKRPGFDPHQFRYWNTANPDLEHPEYIEQDFARHEALCRGEWSYQGCIARAVVSYAQGANSRRLEVLSSSGVYGIESDSSPLFIASTELEQLIDLRDHVLRFGVPWTEQQDRVIWEAEEKLRQFNVGLAGVSSG